MARVSQRRRVLVLLLEHVHVQDMAGPVQVFAEADSLGGQYKLSFHGVSTSVRSAQGLTLGELLPLPEVHGGDLVLVPGIDSRKLASISRPAALWLKEALATGASIASICSGSFALSRAGLLHHRRCTTHWKLTKRLQSEVPSAEVLEDRLYVRDDQIWTSAGVAAGIDLALAVVEEQHGPLVAARVAREMVVYVRRSGDQHQTSIFVDHRNHLNPGVHRVQDFIAEHPEVHTKLRDLARLANVSQRHLTRIFRRVTGVSPTKYAARVKAQVAADLLRDSNLSIEEITERCGFQDPRHLRRLFRQAYGTSPAAFRKGGLAQETASGESRSSTVPLSSGASKEHSGPGGVAAIGR